MKLFINIAAIISFIIQSIFSIFNLLMLKKPESFGQSLYNDFLIISIPCSCLVVVIFLILYNIYKTHRINRMLTLTFGLIAVFASIIHICQLLILKDLIVTSLVLLLIDGFVLHDCWNKLNRISNCPSKSLIRNLNKN